MITIVDYGMGNLRSVQKSFEKVGAQAHVTSDPDVVASAEKLVLPGVGAFADAMRQLRSGHLVEPIVEFLNRGRPFLGICLGLQLLFEKSFEDGEHEGLGILKGHVARFDLPRQYKVPHMGWNELQIRRRPPLLRDFADGASVYFVHSYHVVPAEEEVVCAMTDYGKPFVSAIWRDNIVATQFHPEKSQQVGLAMLRQFAKS